MSTKNTEETDYTPSPAEERHWHFAKWLIGTGRLTEYPSLTLDYVAAEWPQVIDRVKARSADLGRMLSTVHLQDVQVTNENEEVVVCTRSERHFKKVREMTPNLSAILSLALARPVRLKVLPPILAQDS